MQRTPLVQELDRSFEAWKKLVAIFHEDHGRYSPKFGEPNAAQMILRLSQDLDSLCLQTFPNTRSSKTKIKKESLLIFDNLKASKKAVKESYYRIRTGFTESSKSHFNSSFEVNSNLSGPRWTVIFRISELFAECRGELTQYAVQLGLQIPASETQELSSSKFAATGT